THRSGVHVYIPVALAIEHALTLIEGTKLTVNSASQCRSAGETLFRGIGVLENRVNSAHHQIAVEIFFDFPAQILLCVIRASRRSGQSINASTEAFEPIGKRRSDH